MELSFEKLKALFAERMLIEPDAFVVLTNEDTGAVRIIPGWNIVTNAGDVWYAQKSADETPTNDFDSLYLATTGPASPAKTDDYDDFGGITGEKHVDTGYPKTNDDDTDNTGAGVDIVSWRFQYSTADGPFTNIEWSFISITSAGAGQAILNSYRWAAAWSKDSSTSAKVFANHEMLGS